MIQGDPQYTFLRQPWSRGGLLVPFFHCGVPYPWTSDSQSLRWRFISGSLCVCSMRHMLAFPPIFASSSGARSQPQSIASRSSTQAPRFFLRGTPTFGFPFSSSVVHARLMRLFFPLYRRSCSLIPWCFGTSLIVLPPLCCCSGHHSLFAFSQPASLSTRVRIAVPLRLFVAPCSPPTTCCVLVVLTFTRLLCLLIQPIRPCPRVHDCSTVVAACHHSLSTWHQSVLAHVSGPLPDFPVRASVLDSLFDSFTRILCGCASHHSRRRPGSSPRTRQPLWWNDACYHALVARNGSWRDFRRSGSPEDQARFRLLRQHFHSTVRSSRTHFWNEWLGSVTSLSRRAPRLASSLIRRTFGSLVVTPDLCHVQWHGASCSALPPDEARSHWRAHFSSPTGDSPFSDDFFHSLSLRFASLTSLHESGRFDAPFSFNELVAALSDCLP